MPGGFLLDVAILFGACLLHALARRLATSRQRADGAPSLSLLRLSATADLVAGAGCLIAILSNGELLAPMRYLGVRDPLPALLIGVLGGLFLHVTGGGSPLPFASLRPSHAAVDASEGGRLGPATLLLLLSGVAAEELIWRGIGFAGTARVLPGAAALAISASGYGLQRHLAGEDTFALAAMDGVLLVVIFRLSHSLLAAIVAHLVADLYAYTSAADRAGLEAPVPTAED